MQLLAVIRRSLYCSWPVGRCFRERKIGPLLRFVSLVLVLVGLVLAGDALGQSASTHGNEGADSLAFEHVLAEVEAAIDTAEGAGQESVEFGARWLGVPDEPIEDYADRIYLGSWPPNQYPLMTGALYRPVPSNRYNRVEGWVFGVGVRPLIWEDAAMRAVYGRVSYSLALRSIRYEIGAESRLGDLLDMGSIGVKVGGARYRSTQTNDRWKHRYRENSQAALIFRNDLMDYFEVDGWTLYTVMRLNQEGSIQHAMGYRSDQYRSLAKNTSWSIFKNGVARINPPIHEGRMHSLLYVFEAGQVRDYHYWPKGQSIRLDAEVGTGLGGDFSFARYMVDGRIYQPVLANWAAYLRVHAGYATPGAPAQKRFTMGGLGSVRGYLYNGFRGTRMWVANLEAVRKEVDLRFLELQLLGLADVGWVGTGGSNRSWTDTVKGSAGIGVALFGRRVRFEMSWPLLNTFDPKPVIWFRIQPTF